MADFEGVVKIADGYEVKATPVVDIAGPLIIFKVKADAQIGSYGESEEMEDSEAKGSNIIISGIVLGNEVVRKEVHRLPCSE